jgi:alkylation response protein AidB-like acyl-CoA dehydrogenase
MITSESDEMLQMLLDSADAFLVDRHKIGRLRIGADPVDTIVDPAIWQQMAELGWLGLGLPESMGGAGLPFACAAALCERLGRSLFPEPLIAAGLMPGALLAACPVSPKRDELAAGLVSGATAQTVAWQEAPDRFPSDDYDTILSDSALTGRKMFVPLSLPQTTLLTVAREAGEPVLAAVPAESAGIEMRSFRMGDGSRSAELTLQQVLVTDPILVRGPTVSVALNEALNLGTLALAAQLSGLAEGALALSLDYLKTRNQFGKAIGAFQALQHRAVDLYLLVELAKASWRHAVQLNENLPGDQVTIAAISAAKITAIRAARATSQAGVQFFGAMGFTEEADIGLYLRSALQWGAWLGSESAHRRRFYTAPQQGKEA